MYVFASRVEFAPLSGSSGSSLATAATNPKVNDARPSRPKMTRRARSLSLRMRRRFGARAFLRNSARTAASVAPVALEELTGNAVDVLPEGGLEAKLKLGRPLRVKLGIDPTSPDIHLGFAYVLDRLAEFQRAGHVVVLIVGDYTARIGDPSGRSAERPVLDDAVLDANAHVFADQAYRILDPARTEIRFNGEWLATLSYADVVRLTRTMTVARLLERDDFAKRFAAHAPISLSELLYPMMQ